MTDYRSEFILHILGDHQNLPKTDDTTGLTSVADSKSFDADIAVEGLITAALVLHTHSIAHNQISLDNLYIVNGVAKLYAWDKAVWIDSSILDAKIDDSKNQASLIFDFKTVKKCIAELLEYKCKYESAYRIALAMPTIQEMAAICDISYKPPYVKKQYRYTDLPKTKITVIGKLIQDCYYAKYDVDKIVEYLAGGEMHDENICKQIQHRCDYTIKTVADLREKFIWQCLDYRPVGLKVTKSLLDSKATKSLLEDLIAAAQFLLTNHINHGAFTLDNFRLIDGRYRLVNFGKAVFGEQDIKQIRELIPDFEYKPEEFSCVVRKRYVNPIRQAELAVMEAEYPEPMRPVFWMIVYSDALLGQYQSATDDRLKKMMAFMCGDESSADPTLTSGAYFH